MYSIVLELGTMPIAKNDRTASYVLPSWFTSGIAESVDDATDQERQTELDDFVHSLWGNCRRNGDELRFNQRMKLDYFKAKYQQFIEAAAALSTCDEEVFAGLEYSEQFSTAVGSLNRAYEDKFGCYIYDRRYEELKTLDAWVREMDPEVAYYAGAVIKYKA